MIFFDKVFLSGGVKIKPPNFFNSLPQILQIGEIAIFLYNIVRVAGFEPATLAL